MNRTYERRWVRFAKGGKMKYIGHLDLLKVIQMAIKRAKLPVAYSMGFNPHQRLSFALPLSVGVESVCEYMEILLDEPADIMLLDKQLPDGLKILSVYEVDEKAKSPAAIVTTADYRLTFDEIKEFEDGVKESVKKILDVDEIMVTKKTKKGIKDIDIRPDILSLEYDPVGAVMMRLCAGSERNLSPAIVSQKIFEYIGKNDAAQAGQLLRHEVYGNGEGNRLVLLHEAI